MTASAYLEVMTLSLSLVNFIGHFDHFLKRCSFLDRGNTNHCTIVFQIQHFYFLRMSWSLRYHSILCHHPPRVRSTSEVKATTIICTKIDCRICTISYVSLSIFDHGFAIFLYEFLFFEVIVASEDMTKAFVDFMATSVNLCEPLQKQICTNIAQNRDWK